MAISRKKKESLVENYIDRLKDSEGVIITEYRGTKVTELEQLRKRIREADGSFAIVKNTLARRALVEAGLPVPEDLLIGPVGIGFCHHNITGVAKAMTSYAKENELVVIKGGLMGENIINSAAVKSLADLPSIEVLRAQLLGLINTPATRLAGVLAGSVRQVVNVVNAYAEKGSDGASAEAVA